MESYAALAVEAVRAAYGERTAQTILANMHVLHGVIGPALAPAIPAAPPPADKDQIHA
jgi:hypothetical protein